MTHIAPGRAIVFESALIRKDELVLVVDGCAKAERTADRDIVEQIIGQGI